MHQDLNILSQMLIDGGQKDAAPDVAIRHAAGAGLLIVTNSSMADPGDEPQPALLSASANLVADVLSNHMAQEIDLLRRNPLEDREKLKERLIEALRISVRRTSREANALASRRKLRVATTVDAILIIEGLAFICHVGDGRIYLYREERLHRLTREHLPGRLSSDPERRRLIRAVGLHVGVEPETICIEIAPGDRLLALSPWLHRAVEESSLRQIAADPFADGAIVRLIGAARGRREMKSLGAAVLDVTAPTPEGEERTEAQRRIRILARVPLFAYCSDAELRAIAALASLRHAEAGEVVFQDGEQGQELFLVLGGAVQILKQGQELARLGPGSNFGEMSMLDDTRRSATAQALYDAELLVIDREVFRKLLKGDPTLAVKILWNMLLRLSSNLRTTSARLAELEASLLRSE